MRITAVIVAALAALILSGCNMTHLTGVGWESGSSVDVLGVSPDGASEKEVIVFYTESEPYLGHPSSEHVLREHPEAISTVIGFWWQIDRDHYDRVVPFSTTTESGIRETVQLADAQHIRVEGLIHNLLYGRTQWSIDTAARLLSDPSAQKRLIADVIDKALALGLSGINIDIENVPAKYRSHMTEFVQLFGRELHRVGLQLSISVPAKTWDDPLNNWSGAFDYQRIGEAVDRVILMTYDEHGFVSGPGPIASSGWVESAVRYAVSQISPEKVYVGIAGYGFDWPPTAAPRYISYRQAIEQAQRLGIPVQWDAKSNTPYYIYWDRNGTRREVWFESAESSSWKLDLVDRYGLGGVALWRGGLEDPKLWQVISQKYRVAKW